MCTGSFWCHFSVTIGRERGLKRFRLAEGDGNSRKCYHRALGKEQTSSCLPSATMLHSTPLPVAIRWLYSSTTGRWARTDVLAKSFCSTNIVGIARSSYPLLESAERIDCLRGTCAQFVPRVSALRFLRWLKLARARSAKDCRKPERERSPIWGGGRSA
jgi:hypothetical protein